MSAFYLGGAAILLLLIAPLLHAQQLDFGEPVPLGNTRYGPTVAQPEVVSNGRDFFLFWFTDTNLRVTKVVEGEARGGRHVLVNDHSQHFSVAWTGTHFLVVSTTHEGLIGQLLAVNAERVGETFTITDAAVAMPVVASNGRNVLLLYTAAGALHSMTLTPEGTPTGVNGTILPPGIGAGSLALASNGDGYAAAVATPPGVLVVTFDGEGQERSRALAFSGTQPPHLAGHVAIAAGAGHYLAAWQRWDGGGVEAARILADGTVGPTVTIQPPVTDASFNSPLRVAWTGANWAVAYATEQFGADRRLRVAYVHPTAPQVTGVEDAGAGFAPSLAAANGRTLMTWRPDSFRAPAIASLLPLSAHEPEPVTFAAASQDLLATASAADSTLVLWNEVIDGSATLRAGVRWANGNWFERQIAVQGSFEAEAASDGQAFVVTIRGAAGSFALFLDSTARVTGGPVPLPLWPEAVAWNGREYLIASSSSAATLTRSGIVSTPVPASPFAYVGLGWNGIVAMAVMVEPEPCHVLCPGVFGHPRFALLGSDLRPLTAPRLIAGGEEDSIDHAQVVWDRNRFLAAWASSDKVKVAELPFGNAEATIVATFDSVAMSRLHMVAVEGGVVLTWRESTLPNGFSQVRAALVRRDNSTTAVLFPEGGHLVTLRPFVAALPNGRIGHFVPVPRYEAPHHGSTRIVLRVAGAVPPKPDAPHLTGMVRNGRVELEWTAPPQDIAGYRLEYRIGDGSWNEFEQWFDDNDADVTVAWELRAGVPYQFRIRALNDAGASDYSNVVTVNAPKRRSVR